MESRSKIPAPLVDALNHWGTVERRRSGFVDGRPSRVGASREGSARCGATQTESSGVDTREKPVGES